MAIVQKIPCAKAVPKKQARTSTNVHSACIVVSWPALMDDIAEVSNLAMFYQTVCSSDRLIM
jgi:hypothetical protein